MMMMMTTKKRRKKRATLTRFPTTATRPPEWTAGPAAPTTPTSPTTGNTDPCATPPAAGTGKPTTSRVTITIPTPRPSDQQPLDPTSPKPNPIVTPVPAPGKPTGQQPFPPAPKPAYDAGTETEHCYYDEPGLLARRSQLEVAVFLFCVRYDGVTIRDNEFRAIAIPISGWIPDERLTPAPGTVRIGVYGRNNVEFRLA
ncbi:hypothetical protein VTG60DRAFT_4075 [Thermothelomyces hinnuleus]